MGTSFPFRRALAAIALTGVTSSFIISLTVEGEYSAKSDLFEPNSLAFTLWMLLSMATTMLAALLGLFCEWPKAVLLSRRQSGGFGLQLGVNLVIAVVIGMAGRYLIESTLPISSADEPSLRLSVALLMAFAFGSAVFWWQLVILPWRKARHAQAGYPASQPASSHLGYAEAERIAAEHSSSYRARRAVTSPR